MREIGLLAGCLGLDLLLKETMEQQEDAAFPRELAGSRGKIRLYKNHNAGFCFGFLKEKPALVKTVPLVMTSAAGGILAWLLSHRKQSHALERLGFTLITAGGLSNLIDRLRRGYVVDYFSIEVKGLRKAVYNLGDLFLGFGSLLLVVSELLRGEGGAKSRRKTVRKKERRNQKSSRRGSK